MNRRSRGNEAHFKKVRDSLRRLLQIFSRAELKRVWESFDFASAGAK